MPESDPKTNLNILDLPNIFQSLSDNRRTGTLKVKSRNQEKSVYFKDGFIQMVHTPLKSTILGEALIKTKTISEETLLNAVGIQKKTGKRFGETLIGMGAITEAQLVAALTFQIAEEVCELFTWDDLHCEFAPGPPPTGLLSLDSYTSQIALNPGALMMEAARRIDEWELIKRTLPSMKDVLVLSNKLPGKYKGTLKHELVKWIDGLRDVEETTDRARMSKFNALKTIRDLIEEKFLRPKTAEELVDTARLVQRRGGPKEENLQKIINLYERAEELGMKNAKLSLWLAKAYERLNQNKESATRYKTLGEVSLEKGDLEEASGHYYKIIEMNRDDLDSHEKLVETCLKLKRFDEAVDQTMALIEKYAAAGKPESALALARLVRSLVNDNPVLLQAIAKLHLDAGDNIQALIEYESAGEILMDKEEYNGAIVIYERMLDIDDENIDAHFKLATAYTKIGETDKAVACYKTLADTLTTSGVLQDSINWQFLINIYENIVAIEPGNVTAREWLSDAYESKEEHEKAVSHLEGLLAALGESGAADKKSQALRKILALRPDDYPSRRRLAQVCKDAGRIEEAVNELGDLASIAMEKGDFDVGLEAFRGILAINPLDIETVAGVGKIFEIAGRYPEAAQQYRKAANLYYASAKLDKAVRFFLQAAEMDHDQGQSLLDAADLERQRGNLPSALNILSKFVKQAIKSRNFGYAKSACGLILSLKSNHPWARKVMERIDSMPDEKLDSEIP